MNPWQEPIVLNVLPDNAKVVAYGHRSGAETHMRCPRAYFYQYEYLGHGINVAPTPLNLRVGSAVHQGLGALLSDEGIDAAVSQALDYLFNCRIYQTLTQDQQVEQEVLVHGLLYAYWRYAHESVMKQFEVLMVEKGCAEYIPLLYPEICGVAIGGPRCPCGLVKGHEGEHIATHAAPSLQAHIAMQSRPDAILRNRSTGETVGWSWKTIDDPTDLRRSQFVNDLQGFMEMYYGERILEVMRGSPVTKDELDRVLQDYIYKLTQDNYSVECTLEAMRDFAQDTLRERVYKARNIPTQIDYIQTVFLVKGKRKLLEETEMPWINSASITDDSDEYGGYAPNRQYKQMSHLCYRYRNSEQTNEGEVELYKTGPNKGKPKPVNPQHLADESWAYRFYKPGNETFSQLNPKWLTSPIQPDQVRAWIDRLYDGTVYPSTMNDERNPHPLAKVVLFETPLYRDASKAAMHVQQQRNRFVQIAQSVQRLNLITVLEEHREKLDQEFPQHLINCRTPYRCAYHDFCHTSRENEIDFVNVPEGFAVREPHHPVERDMRGVQGK